MYMTMYTLPVPKVYSVASARIHLPDILDDVEAGNEVHLSRRGQHVAVVLSRRRYEALRGARPGFASAYRGFLERHPGGDIGLGADFFSVLRDRTPGRKVRL
jgi:prevent-host-death family protein